MTTEYRYRKHVGWMLYIIPILFGLLIVLEWLPPLIAYLRASPNRAQWMDRAIVKSVIFLIEALALTYLFYRLAGVRVSIVEDALIYRNRSGERTIRFCDITELKFPSLRYIGGWVKIVSADEAIRLTVVIENIGDFLVSRPTSSILESSRFADQKYL